jgi:hypothetical protein
MVYTQKAIKLYIHHLCNNSKIYLNSDGERIDIRDTLLVDEIGTVFWLEVVLLLFFFFQQYNVCSSIEEASRNTVKCYIECSCFERLFSVCTMLEVTV